MVLHGAQGRVRLRAFGTPVLFAVLLGDQTPLPVVGTGVGGGSLLRPAEVVGAAVVRGGRRPLPRPLWCGVLL